jgi:hypothetical protein
MFIPSIDCIIEAGELNRITKVQLSDTTGDEQENEVDKIIINRTLSRECINVPLQGLGVYG